MFLGIEIGGTKLQLGVGRGDGALVALERAAVDPARGAEGIRSQIELLAARCLARRDVRGIGIGFGGPVDRAAGRVVKSHHVHGWDDFPLVEWCRETLDLPAVLENDCDAAALAEASWGAGVGHNPVFYVTVGTGIGGGLVVDGTIYRASGHGAAEIGHLRPGLHAQHADQTVESLASGWGIAAAAHARLIDPISHRFEPLTGGMRRMSAEDVRQRLIETEDAEEAAAADLLARCDGRPEQLSARLVAQAAADGNPLARDVLAHACQALGWGIAQMITLCAPRVVVVGGGVSLAEERLLLRPLRDEVARYVFPPLAGEYELLPAKLGEAVVVHGAVAAAMTGC